MSGSATTGLVSATAWPELRREPRPYPKSVHGVAQPSVSSLNTISELRAENARLIRSDYLCLFLIVVATVIVLGRQITVGGLRYGDASVHAMDGVLIHDWLQAGPNAWTHPISFAEQQYAHYPTLGIGTHYPPGFAFVEAFFFAMFGVSAVTARMCVIAFGLLATTTTYFFARHLAGRVAGAIASIALLTMPATVEWGRQTMLEVPTMAALCTSAWLFARYLRQPTTARFTLVLLSAITAIVFKQTAVFLIVSTATCFVIGGKRKRTSHLCVACLMAALTVIAVWLSLDNHAAQLLRGDATYSNLWSFHVLTGYLQILPDQLGWPILLCSGVGLVVSLIRHRVFGIYLVAWFIACHALLAIADFKYNRYIYPALFPFAIWAALGIDAALKLPLLRARSKTRSEPRPLGSGPKSELRANDSFNMSGARATQQSEGLERTPRRFAIALTMILCVTACGISWTQATPIRPDYGSIITAHRTQFTGQAIFFHGLRDGDFVFAARQHLPWRSGVVIRGSKLLYTCNSRPNLDFEPRVQSPDELANLMDQYAFRYVVAEREDRLGIPQVQWLQNYLTYSGAYQLIASHPMQADSTPRKCDVTVDVYQSTRSPDSSPTSLDIPIPRSNRTIRVDLPSR
ncbi:MAG: glycosyltransferase family 39 protein [Planctomycetota bacterium]